MAEIFISYRRRDTWGHAQLLQEQLVRWFGEEGVFFDRDGESIPRAEKFPLAIEKAVKAAEVALAVIGPDWLSEENKRRLFEDENDFVRRELALSLRRMAKGENFLVYPILVGGADMPSADDLPPELAGFETLQALVLGSGTGEYRIGIDGLIEWVNSKCHNLRARRQNAWVYEGLISSDLSLVRFKQDIAVCAQGKSPIKRLDALTNLDAWLGQWGERHQAFVLLGEEGDGKSWATAEWLAGKLKESDFNVPVVIAPALRMKSASVTDILSACLAESLSTPSEGWLKRLDDLSRLPPSKAPFFLLVVDALNERASLDWRELFDTIRAEPWHGRVALLVLSRNRYWESLNIANDGLISTWTLSPYNDHELNQALAQRGGTRDQFSPDVLDLMARPRYFDLAYRLHGEIEKGGLTLERLIYEDWRDITSRKRHINLSHENFQALIVNLAGEYEQRRFTTPGFSQQAQGITSDTTSLCGELLSVRILDSRSGKLTITPRYLVLGLGLILAEEVVESGENVPEVLGEIIAKRMGAYREADLQVRICGMALFHALNTDDYPEVGRIALLRAWVEGRNLNEEDLMQVAAYLPLRPKTYLRMAEYLWSDTNSEAQDAFMAGFLRHRDQPGVREELKSAFSRWLGFVYPWGYRGYFERDEEKRGELRQEMTQKLGCEAKPGPVYLLGVDLEVVEEEWLSRLAQVALAVISHDRGRGYAHELLAGIVAATVMEGSHAEFSWVLRTCNSETAQELLSAASNFLVSGTPTAYLAARKLLICLGSAEARSLLTDIPAEYHFVHPLEKMREETPCKQFFGAWDENNYRMCLEQPDCSPSFAARQLRKVALNPDIDFPEPYRLRLNDAGEELDLTKVRLFMGATLEHQALDEMEPALCAFAASHFRELMCNLAREIANRDGLPRKLLAQHLVEYFPIFGIDEKNAALVAWRATLLQEDEHSQHARLYVFPIVMYGLSAEKQFQLFLECGDSWGFFTRHAALIRPLALESAPSIQAALEASISEQPERLNGLLCYLTYVLGFCDDKIRETLLAHFEEFDTVARRYCLEIFANTADSAATRRIVDSGWRAGYEHAKREEAAWGSHLLAKLAIGLPFDEVVARISPEWLGYAVVKRGCRPEEVAAYADVLDAIWRDISERPLPAEAETLSRYAVLKVNPDSERIPEKLSVDSANSKSLYLANYTWGGSAGNGSFEDIQSLDSDAQLKRHQVLYEQVTGLADRERSNGNPWFYLSFRDGALAEVITQTNAPWKQWISPVLRRDIHAKRLLLTCGGFYEKLCAALLRHSPEEGLALFKAIEWMPGVRIHDARLDQPILLMDAFAAPHSPQVERIVRDHFDACSSDKALFETALLCLHGNRSEWLPRLAKEMLASRYAFDQARGLTLLGCSSDREEGKILYNWIADTQDSWVLDVAKAARKSHLLNQWARRWFEKYLSRSDRVEAWAAFRLFLRCVDRRFWLWVDDTSLKEAETWKREAIAINVDTIKNACKENEKEKKDYFLGQKVKPNELWPWMEKYQ